MIYPIFNNNKNQSKLIPFVWAAFFLISMLVLVKYFLITFLGLYEPIFQWAKLTLSESKVTNGLVFQFVIVCKILSLLISSGFIFIVSSAFSTIFSHIFYQSCSKNYKKLDYPLKDSVVKGIKWSFYRIFLVLAPPLSVIMLGSLLFLSSIALFNLLLKIAGISVTLTTFLMSFINFSVMFLFILSLLISLYQLASTIFGTVIAVSEPDLENKTIEKRAKNLISFKLSNIFLCLGYLLFVYSLFIQIKSALISNILTNPESQWLVALAVIFDLVYLSIFEYFKSSSYIDSLLKYSERLSKSPIKALMVKEVFKFIEF